MNEDIIERYQQTMALIRGRNPEMTYVGDFTQDVDGKYAFKLTRVSKDAYIKTMTFEFKDNHTEALEDFIFRAQNLYFN